MLVKEEIETINSVLGKIFEFIATDEKVQQNLQQYTEIAKSRVSSEAELQSALMAYIFDSVLESGKKIFDLYIEKNPDLPANEKEIMVGMSNSMASVYKVLKVSKEGFELHNIINEKTYKVSTLIKMVNFRGIIPDQYLACRIFPYQDTYYITGIESVIPATLKENAYRYAVTQQMNNPELIYKDNDEKLVEVEKTIETLETKFLEYFKKDEIITQSKFVDELLSHFNDFIDDDKPTPKEVLKTLIVSPEKFGYFEVKEVTENIFDPMLAATKGFASHEKNYDVGVIFDQDTGLLVLPFYGTFKQIFSSPDYKNVDGYKDCVMQYLESSRVPPAPIQRVYNENKDNFAEIIKDVLNLEEPLDIDELLHKYKSSYLEKRNFSALTILYLSDAFNELMEIARSKQEQEEASINIPKNIGRNDPCPCGSGKKYKKCCCK